jgi:polysaccharide export outer membrane protein
MKARLWFVMTTLLIAATSPELIHAQTSGAATAQLAPSEASNDYTIGAGDVISVSMPEAQEFGGKFRVSDSGTVDIPGLASSVNAAGETPAELARSIRQALIDAKQLRDPKVTVFVDEFHGRRITVLGAVTKPAVYPLDHRTTVLEAVSMAGGALPGAGSAVTIVRGKASAEATGTAVGSVQIIDLARLSRGEDPAANVEVQNGDVISVSAAQIVYVVGAVIKPGGFVMSNPSAGISVVQAIAMAEGFNGVAATNRAVIMRQSTNDMARQEIPVDISQMIGGKTADVLLAPNDILYIPESGAKKALKALGQVALAAADGVAIYGVGYRAAGISP